MDIRLHYMEQGEGFPLILLHGNGEDSSYFAGQIGFFAARFRVIAVDTRGHGRSPKGTRPFTLEQFAEDLLAFLQERQIEKAHLLGFSDGGNIALLFALRWPERVERLVLNGANLTPDGLCFRIRAAIRIGYRLSSHFAGRSRKTDGKAELLRLMAEEPQIPAEALRQIPCRTLVIVGTRDMIRKKHTLLLYRSLPRAELARLPGNHFIAARRPALFNETVMAFLTAGAEDPDGTENVL